MVNRPYGYTADYVIPNNVLPVVNDILHHRIILSYEANAKGVNSDRGIDEIVKLAAAV